MTVFGFILYSHIILFRKVAAIDFPDLSIKFKFEVHSTGPDSEEIVSVKVPNDEVPNAKDEALSTYIKGFNRGKGVKIDYDFGTVQYATLTRTNELVYVTVPPSNN